MSTIINELGDSPTMKPLGPHWPQENDGAAELLKRPREIPRPGPSEFSGQFAAQL